MNVVIKLTWHSEADQSMPLPTFQTPGSSGADVHANLGTSEKKINIRPGESKLIPTGFCLEIPKNYEVQIRPRSGLALKHGITVLNSPGTIDSDYRDAVGVILINTGQHNYEIHHGDRIAQLIVSPTVKATFTFVTEISETNRGGFGSTGKK